TSTRSTSDSWPAESSCQTCGTCSTPSSTTSPRSARPRASTCHSDTTPSSPDQGGDVITSFAGIIRTHGREKADKPAIDFEGTTLTFGQLDERSSRLATALASAGVGAGDRVAFL